MSESRKNTPLRLSPELRGELDREKGARLIRGESASYGQIIRDWWHAYESQRNGNGDGHKPPSEELSEIARALETAIRQATDLLMRLRRERTLEYSSEARVRNRPAP